MGNPVNFLSLLKLPDMIQDQKDFNDEQLKTIAELRKVLDRLKVQDVRISGIGTYEVNIFKDANGKPYISIA